MADGSAPFSKYSTPKTKGGQPRSGPPKIPASGLKGGFRFFSKEDARVERRRQAAQNRKAGPARNAPMFYAGESFGGRLVQYPDVERYPNGGLPAKRDKRMRRVIRRALKARFSSITKPLRLAQGLRAQAYEVARDEKKSGRFARRLLEKELKIHQAAYVPDSKELRKLRTEKRARIRKGLVGDAISALVDKMAGKQP